MPKPYTPNDKYFYKAKKQGFRARSVFKLDEIQNRFNLIKKGDRVLDLGAAPGSFLQCLSPMIGKDGLAVGVDLQEIAPLKLNNVATIQADIFDIEALRSHFEYLKIRKFDAITADLAPKTTGIKGVDEYRSYELNMQVLSVTKEYLKAGGVLVTKIFLGEEFDDFLKEVKKCFKKIKTFKPKATRDRSRETYVVAQGYFEIEEEVAN